MWLWHSLQLYSRLKYSDIYSLNYYSSILHYITHVSLQHVCYQFSQGHNLMTTSFFLKKKSSFITIPILRSTFYLRVKSNQNVCIRCDHGIVYSYIPSSRAFRGSDVYPLKYCSSILHYITPVFSCVFVTKICRWCQHARSR